MVLVNQEHIATNFRYVPSASTVMIHHIYQGFSIIFPCGPQRAKDSSKIHVWRPNDHHFPMYYILELTKGQASMVCGPDLAHGPPFEKA